jgi:hypothetical protein
MIPIRAGFELLRGACHLLGFLTEGSDNTLGDATPHARLKSGAMSSGRKHVLGAPRFSPYRGANSANNFS